MTTKKSESLQRALDAAADLFISKRFEDVSMSAIAQAARCSTTTMYEIWGSKEQLFIEALSHRQCGTPIPSKLPHETGFQALLRYVHARIVMLSSPETHAVTIALLREIDRVRENFSRFVRDNWEKSDPALRSILSAAIAEGMVRRMDMDVLVCSIRAVSSYQPLLERLTFGHTRFSTPQSVMTTVFLPLVTEAGELALNCYLAEQPDESANDDAVSRMQVG